MVVNDHRLVEANAFPARSFAPVPISAIYFVFGEKSCSGSNIAVLASGLRDEAPFIRVDSSSALLRVNVFSLIVGLLIGSLNVALISELTGTCVDPSAGIVLSTFGGPFSEAAAAAEVTVRSFVVVAAVAAACVFCSYEASRRPFQIGSIFFLASGPAPSILEILICCLQL